MQMPRTKLHFSETVLSFGLKLNDFENLDVKRQFWREQRRDLRARSAFHHFIDTTLASGDHSSNSHRRLSLSPEMGVPLKKFLNAKAIAF